MNSRPAANGRLPCAVGAVLTPAGLLDAMRAGWIVVPIDRGLWQEAAELRYGRKVDDGSIPLHPPGSPRGFDFTYWNPAERFVIPAAEARIAKRLRRTLRDVEWTSTIDRAFPEVVEECGRDRRPRWLTDAYTDVLTALWKDGRAYSAEIWEGGQLVAGGFGYVVGDAVSIESTFTHRSGASKVSMTDIAHRAAEAGCELVDLQWPTEHGAQIGGRPAPTEHLICVMTAPTHRKLPADERPIGWRQDAGT